MNRIIKKAMREKGSKRLERLRAVRAKLFVRFFAFLVLTAALICTAAGLTSAMRSYAADTNFETQIAEGPGANISENAVQETNPDGEIAPDESSVLYDLIGIDASQPLEILLLITVISVAPSILLMMTSFTRIIIVLSFMRNAMATQQTPPNQVLVGLALFLTLFLMWPVFMQINQVAFEPYSNGEVTLSEAVGLAGEPMKTFMLKQTSPNTLSFFLDLSDAVVYSPETADTDNPVPASLDDRNITLDNYQEQLGFEVVIPAFMLSELSRAFQMGFMIFVPFLIIDIVVASTLMSMGMMMLPPAMISMPFKIMLFVLVDGWTLLVGSIVTSFNL